MTNRVKLIKLLHSLQVQIAKFKNIMASIMAGMYLIIILFSPGFTWHLHPGVFGDLAVTVEEDHSRRTSEWNHRPSGS